ncbi:hypothetical protein [Scytonema sp. NUACC26]|uniref:hypothetical protein n=1 Tax=Scytonema sp. NUACC26 TaxID=3140176 RepID=UPI0038B35C47
MPISQCPLSVCCFVKLLLILSKFDFVDEMASTRFWRYAIALKSLADRNSASYLNNKQIV